MRHLVFGRRLSRDTNARKALLRNLASSFLARGSITTTLTRAKFARSYIEKLITQARRGDLSIRRSLASVLTNEAFSKLMGEVGPVMAKRAGGYTRIIRLVPRRGDGAPMARLELVATAPLPLAGRDEGTGKKRKSVIARKSVSKSTKSKNEKR